jgi:hypothetical protein
MEGWQSGNAPDLKSGESERMQGFKSLTFLHNGTLVEW